MTINLDMYLDAKVIYEERLRESREARLANQICPSMLASIINLAQSLVARR